MRTKSKEFKKLQREWYNKLKSTGFKDVEIPSSLFSIVEDTPYLHKGECVIINCRRRIGTEGTIEYINHILERNLNMQNYITHNRNINSLDWFIGYNYSEGLSIRSIIKKFNAIACPYPRKKRSPNAYSVYKIFTIIKRLNEEAYRWNKTDPNGRYYLETPNNDIYSIHTNTNTQGF